MGEDDIDLEAIEDANAPLSDEVRPEQESTKKEDGSEETEQSDTAADAKKSEEEGESADSSTASEDAKAESKGEEDKGDKPKSKSGAQKRIDELTAKRRDAERRAEEAEKRAKEAEEALAKADTKPDEDKFESPEEYQAALSAWYARRSMRDEESRTAKANAEQAGTERAAARQEAFNARVEAVKGNFDKFEEVAFNPKLSVTPAMGDLIVESEKGPELLYHLGSNPDEAFRISQLSPLAAAKELGKIEASLSIPARRTVTTASDPITPVSGGGSNVQKDPSKMSNDEYRAYRAKGGGR